MLTQSVEFRDNALQLRRELNEYTNASSKMSWKITLHLFSFKKNQEQAFGKNAGDACIPNPCAQIQVTALPSIPIPINTAQKEAGGGSGVQVSSVHMYTSTELLAPGFGLGLWLLLTFGEKSSKWVISCLFLCLSKKEIKTHA